MPMPLWKQLNLSYNSLMTHYESLKESKELSQNLMDGLMLELQSSRSLLIESQTQMTILKTNLSVLDESFQTLKSSIRNEKLRSFLTGVSVGLVVGIPLGVLGAMVISQ